MKKVFIWPVVLYLRFWARAAFAIHAPYVIGIAGSVGKSSARNALSAALKDYFSVKMIHGNSETGVPLGILGIEPKGFGAVHWIQMLLKAPFGLMYIKNVRYVIIEMGIDEPDPPKNMDYLLTVVAPDMAISLNIGGPHLAQFEKTLTHASREVRDNPERRLEYILYKMAEEDTKIITKSDCRVGIYNGDDRHIVANIDQFKALPVPRIGPKLLPFGKDKTNPLSYGEYRLSTKGTQFEFICEGQKMDVRLVGFTLPEGYRETFAAVILGARELGLSFDQVTDSLQKNFILPPGRASVFEGIKDSLIIDSSYNASKKAVLTFLELARALKKQTHRPVVFLFGDMRELGEEAEQEHAAVALKIPEVVDYLYCVGPLTNEFVIPRLDSKKFKEIRWFENSVAAGEYLRKNIPKNSLVLVKGSQNTIFLEEAIKFILKNKSDWKKLCRQEEYWKRIKEH